MRVDVAKNPEGWRVFINGRPVSSFEDKAEAERAAARIATVLRACDLPVSYTVAS